MATVDRVCQWKFCFELFQSIASENESQHHAGGRGAARYHALASRVDLETQTLEPVVGVIRYECELLQKDRILGVLQLEHVHRMLGHCTVTDVRTAGQIFPVA